MGQKSIRSTLGDTTPLSNFENAQPPENIPFQNSPDPLISGGFIT